MDKTGNTAGVKFASLYLTMDTLGWSQVPFGANQDDSIQQKKEKSLTMRSKTKGGGKIKPNLKERGRCGAVAVYKRKNPKWKIRAEPRRRRRER